MWSPLGKAGASSPAAPLAYVTAFGSHAALACCEGGARGLARTSPESPSEWARPVAGGTLFGMS